MGGSSESELLAQELSIIAAKVVALETRMTEVETVIERLGGSRLDDSPRLRGSLGALGRGVSGDAARRVGIP